jgi:hypothetical protein
VNEVSTVHPEFLALHAKLASIEGEVEELRASGVPTATILSLYPVSMSAYLPFLSAHFKSALDIHAFWQSKDLDETGVAFVAYTMIDRSIANRAFFKQELESKQSVDLIDRCARVHNRSKLTENYGVMSRGDFEHRLTNLLNLMLLLSNWDPKAYKQLHSNDQLAVIKAISAAQTTFDLPV